MSTQCFYLHMQLKFTTINSWQTGRENVISSSNCILFQESISQAVLKLSAVWKNPKILGCPSTCGAFLKMKPSALSLLWGAPGLTIPNSRFSRVPEVSWWIVGVFSQPRFILWEQSCGTSQTGAPQSLAGARLGKGVCCSAGSAREENNTQCTQSEAGEAGSLAANCTGARSPEMGLPAAGSGHLTVTQRWAVKWD